MLEYLKEFNNLPQKLRDNISGSGEVKALNEIEKKYQANLATFVMKIMIKKISIEQLAQSLIKEKKIKPEQEKGLIQELKQKVFLKVLDYLYLENKIQQTDKKENLENKIQKINHKKQTTDSTISQFSEKKYNDKNKSLQSPITKLQPNEIIKVEKKPSFEIISPQNNQLEEIIKKIIIKLNLEKQDQIKFEKIIQTYLKKIRNKIDTIQTLGKEKEKGGLNLKLSLTEKILNIIDKNNNTEVEEKKIVKKPLIRVIEDNLKNSKQTTQIIKTNIPTENKKYDLENRKPKLLKQVDKQNTQIIKENKQVENKVKKIDHQQPQDNQDNNENINDEKVTARIREAIKGEHKKINNNIILGGARDVAYDFESLKNKKQDVQINNQTKQTENLIEKTNHQKQGLNSSVISQPLEKNYDNDYKDNKNKSSPSTIEKIKSEKQKIIEPINNKPQNIKIKQQTVENENQINVKNLNSKLNINQEKINGKIRMDDVKYIPNLMGPIDELKNFNLTNFRRYDLKKTSKMITLKLSLLEEEDLTKRFLGIKAWYKSPLIRLYLQLGQESLIKKISLEKIIEDKKQNNKDYLNLKEFEAIINLNQSINYPI